MSLGGIGRTSQRRRRAGSKHPTLLNPMSDPIKSDSPDGAVDLPRFVRPAWMTGEPDCDWIEDSSHENGNYFCKCLPCGSDFIGHKRRLVCRKCYMANKAEIDAMSEETREEYFARRDEELREWVKANIKTLATEEGATK